MQADHSTSEPSMVSIAPDTTTPRVFGILNIIFSILAGLFSIYTLAMAVMMPYMAQSMEEAAQRADEAAEKQLAALEEEIAQAETEEEKAELRMQRNTLANQKDPPIPNVWEAMNNPKVITYGIVDGSTGVLLNLMMFVSGIGLLMRKEWARKLAIWTAATKIGRLLILQLVNIVMIVPIHTKAAQQMFEQMDMGGGPGAGSIDMAGMQGIMYTAMAVVTLAVGSVYPALSLWFLSRPSVKVVCQPDFEDYSVE